MVSNLLNLLNPKIILVTAVAAVFIAGAVYTKYLQTSLSSIEKKLEETKQEKIGLENALEDTVTYFTQKIEIEKDKTVFQTTTLKEKEQVIKASEKVKYELAKIKEMKQDEKDCPKLSTFSF